MLEPGTSFCKFVLNSSMSSGLGFFPWCKDGIQVISHYNEYLNSRIPVCTEWFWLYRKFKTRNWLLWILHSCVFHYLLRFNFFPAYFLLQVFAKYIPAFWLWCYYPKKRKTKFKFVLFEAFLHSLKKTEFSRKVIVLYRFIIYFLFFKEKHIYQCTCYWLTLKYWITSIKV